MSSTISQTSSSRAAVTPGPGGYGGGGSPLDPLQTSVAIADATGGNAAEVERYVSSDVGAGRLFTSAPPRPPIGMAVPASYEMVSVSVPAGASVLAYTDGHAGELLDAVADALAAGGVKDDIALLELHWTS